MKQRTLHEQLANHLRNEMRAQGVSMDKYDPDFIIGSIEVWCSRNDTQVTADGVSKRFYYS